MVVLLMKNHAFAPILIALPILSLVGCAGPVRKTRSARSATDAANATASTTPPTGDAAELGVRVARWRAWEPKGLSRRTVQFPDIFMSAEIESKAEPKVSCEKLESGSLVCNVGVDLGPDDDGDANGFSCTAVVSRIPLPFGLLFKQTLAGRTIEEVPIVEVENLPKDITASRVVVPSYGERDQSTAFATTKVAVAYGPGYTLTCEDNGAGGSAAFRRISSRFFTSAAFSKMPPAPMLRAAFKQRRGESVRGFSLATVHKEEDGYWESHQSFYLETNGKSWSVFDGQQIVERDAKGAVESMRHTRWFDGGAPVVVSAKPGESGKIRVKVEGPGKSESIEMTPKAPVSTELWEAPALRKVSSAAGGSHKYAFPSISADGEPTLHYAALSRAKVGVVLEEIDHGTKKKKTSAEEEHVEKNEISVDERGFSTKQVSAENVYERLFLTGELPARSGAKAPARKKAP